MEFSRRALETSPVYPVHRISENTVPVKDAGGAAARGQWIIE